MLPHEGNSAYMVHDSPLASHFGSNGLSDPSRLAPEDAYYSPPRRARQSTPLGEPSAGSAIRPLTEIRRKSHKDRSRSRKKTQWKKLLWVEQQCTFSHFRLVASMLTQADPDNYTDEQTFLHDLKRNPSFQQYEFWPLMADATVIVQHLCSVAIFICCFIGIVQDRVSPVTVVSCGSMSTVLGWAIWDFWISQEELAENIAVARAETSEDNSSREGSKRSSTSSAVMSLGSKDIQGLGIRSATTKSGSQNQSTGAMPRLSPMSSMASLTTGHPTGASSFATYSHYPPHGEPMTSLSPRNQQRLATAKSATLIYCALLGLSPILKSLTKSTTSDSIWAMSCWLMCINVFFFDYGGAVGAK